MPFDPSRPPSSSRRRLAYAVVALVFGAVAPVVACTAEPAVNYGNPGNLNKDNLPGDAGIEPLTCADAGAKGPDGGCTVSWKTDLYPRMIGNDGWKCATAACHAPGKEPPAIDTANASNALKALKAYEMKARPGSKYIDGTGDPNKSTISCNLGGACNPVMPIGDGKPLTGDERCKLDTWLRCGAPDN